MISKFFEFEILFSFYSCKSSIFFSYFVLLSSFNSIKSLLFYCICSGLECCSMKFLGIIDTINNDTLWAFFNCLILLKEINNFSHEPRHNLIFHCSFIWRHKNTNMGEFTKCSFSEASQIILWDEPSIQLLMSRSFFFLSCFILNISSTYFFFTSLLGCFESLSNDKFSVYYFFVFFFLTINYAEFSLFENLHSSLFNDFTAEYI